MDIQTSHQLLDKIAEVKSANGSIAATVLTPQQIAGIEGDAKREAIKNILQVGVIGAGGAVGFRSAQGLWNLLTRAGKPSMSRAGVSPLPVPYPVEEEEEEELRKVAQTMSMPKDLMHDRPRGVPELNWRSPKSLWEGTDEEKQQVRMAGWDPGGKSRWRKHDDDGTFRDGWDWTNRYSTERGHYYDEDLAQQQQFTPQDWNNEARRADWKRNPDQFEALSPEIQQYILHGKKSIPDVADEPPTPEEMTRELKLTQDQEHRDNQELRDDVEEMALDEPNWSSENILGTGISARQLGYGALGGAALGAGGYGLYRYLNRDKDEEEEDDKEAQDNHIKTSPHDYAKWYWPGLLAAAMGGTYGGWKLTDSFFDDRRQEEVEDELESAKEEFQEALTSHYPSPKSKMAAEKTAAQKLGEELDDLFLRIERATSLEKVANGDPISSAIGTATDLVQAPGKVVETVTSPQFKQKAMGAYGLYAIPTLLLGYLAAKHLSDKYSQRKILEKAVQRRAAKNYAKRPSELYAVPDPQVYVEPDEDEEE